MFIFREPESRTSSRGKISFLAETRLPYDRASRQSGIALRLDCDKDCLGFWANTLFFPILGPSPTSSRGAPDPGDPRHRLPMYNIRPRRARTRELFAHGRVPHQTLRFRDNGSSLIASRSGTAFGFSSDPCRIRGAEPSALLVIEKAQQRRF